MPLWHYLAAYEPPLANFLFDGLNVFLGLLSLKLIKNPKMEEEKNGWKL